MKRNILGNTGLEVSVVAFGTLTMSSMQRGLSLEEGRDVVLHGLSAGINFIDTAQMYGSYHQVCAALRKWMGPQPVIASKSTAKDYDAMKQAIQECLEQLHLQKIDVFLLHAVRDAEDFAGRQGALRALLEARSKGLIGALGISSHSALTIKSMIADERIEVLHPMVNRDGIGVLDASMSELTATLKQAKLAGKGIYAMKPLGGGHLRNDAVAALQWLFKSGLVDAAAIGMTSFEEIDMNVAIARQEVISYECAQKVAGQPRQLFINEMICQNCGSCIEACQQKALKPGKDYPQIDQLRCVLCGYCAPNAPNLP